MLFLNKLDLSVENRRKIILSELLKFYEDEKANNSCFKNFTEFLPTWRLLFSSYLTS